MEWADEPATWRQIKSLKELGHTLDHRLTKTEAADLIRSLGGRVPAEPAFVSESVPKPRQMGAQPLRAKVEAAQRAIAEAGQRTSKLDHELSCAICERQDFWIEACGGSGQAVAGSAQVHELYQKHGCRFEAPSRKDVQFILDALDGALPTWDRDHPELFFQTLELNFPALLHQQPRLSAI